MSAVLSVLTEIEDEIGEDGSRIHYRGPRGNTETVKQWITRHKIPQEGGKSVFYHATPKRGGATTSIRKGSYLDQDKDTAIHQAGRDRGLKPSQINVHKVLVSHDEFDPGIFPTLRQDYPIGKHTLVK